MVAELFTFPIPFLNTSPLFFQDPFFNTVKFCDFNTLPKKTPQKKVCNGNNGRSKRPKQIPKKDDSIGINTSAYIAAFFLLLLFSCKVFNKLPGTVRCFRDINIFLNRVRSWLFDSLLSIQS